jgi:hypothetical protein
VKMGTFHCNKLLRYSAIGGNKRLSHYCNYALTCFVGGVTQLVCYVIGWACLLICVMKPGRWGTFKWSIEQLDDQKGHSRLWLQCWCTHITDHVVTMASFNPPCGRRYLLKCYKIISINLSDSFPMKLELHMVNFMCDFNITNAIQV